MYGYTNQQRRALPPGYHGLGLELFTWQDYHGTSMQQIAAQAEISLGGIYNHFSSKEDNYQAVVLECHPVNYVLPNLAQIGEETIEQYVPVKQFWNPLHLVVLKSPTNFGTATDR